MSGWGKHWGSAWHHRKFLAISVGARGLWAAGHAYVVTAESDGFVPAEIVPALHPGADHERLAAELVKVKLWEVVEGGYQMHDFLDWNEPIARRRAKQQAQAERVQRWRQRNALPNASRNALRNGVRNASRAEQSTTTTSAHRAVSAPASFDAFWSAYPRKIAKQSAVRAWQKLAPDEAMVSRILAAIDRQQQTGCLRPLQANDGRSVVPYPASWLNGRRWDDEEGGNSVPPRDVLIKAYRPWSFADEDVSPGDLRHPYRDIWSGWTEDGRPKGGNA